MLTCKIVHPLFLTILPLIHDKFIHDRTLLLSKNILPYNIISLDTNEIVFYTQDRFLYNEMLTNKTAEQLVVMVHAIFSYSFQHLYESPSRNITVT